MNTYNFQNDKDYVFKKNVVLSDTAWLKFS